MPKDFVLHGPTNDVISFFERVDEDGHLVEWTDNQEETALVCG